MLAFCLWRRSVAAERLGEHPQSSLDRRTRKAWSARFARQRHYWDSMSTSSRERRASKFYPLRGGGRRRPSRTAAEYTVDPIGGLLLDVFNSHRIASSEPETLCL